jgi:hypothetical protein
MTEKVKEKMDAKKALEVLQKDVEQRRDDCLAEIQATLDVYKMDLVVNTILTHDQRIVHSIDVASRGEANE